jgi:hypothetical protein
MLHAVANSSSRGNHHHTNLYTNHHYSRISLSLLNALVLRAELLLFEKRGGAFAVPCMPNPSCAILKALSV